MPWLWIPPKGKLEKKSAFSSYCGDEATTYYDRAFYFGPAIWDMLVPSPQHDEKYGLFLQCFRWRALWPALYWLFLWSSKRFCHGIWLLCFCSALEIDTFYLVFPADGLHDWAFYGVFLWPCHRMWLFHPYSTVKTTTFFSSFPLGGILG